MIEGKLEDEGLSLGELDGCSVTTGAGVVTWHPSGPQMTPCVSPPPVVWVTPVLRCFCPGVCAFCTSATLMIGWEMAIWYSTCEEPNG